MSKKLPVFFAEGEPEKLLAATSTQRDRCVLMIFLYAGLRCNELAHLKVSDLDFSRKVIWVRVAKGGKQRMVPMMKRLVGPLRGWVGPRREGQVFPSTQGGGPMTTRALRYLVKRTAERAGFTGEALRRAHCHCFRHEFLCRALRAGADIRELMDLAGHSQLSSAQRYLASDPDRLREAVDRVYE